ncbi:MAG: helix-turn-helix transcriptional regulator [Bacteroidales bacterium]|nr:helix-turn-helix transcriptional regulator [Bacteroidales bacterium]
MKHTKISLREMASQVSPVIKQEVALTMGVSDRLDELMTAKGISKIELARALGKRPNEITRWLSGQHNFTLRTIALLSVFFGESLITITH